MFATDADIRVNTVNCVGVMGAGVALAFKERFPEMFREYKRQCELGMIQPGRLHVWKNLSGDWVINFPTKRHWREKSKYEDIQSGLVALRKYLAEQGKVRVTLPALGSGHGGLDWSRVSTLIRDYLEGLEAEIIVFDPIDSRTIERLHPSGTNAENTSVKKITAPFPQSLAHLDASDIYYEGDLEILKALDLSIGLSLKPEKREELAALAAVNELPSKDITVCLLLGTASATKIATILLEKGIRVAAWIPQGLARYRLPTVLRESHQSSNLLLLSLAKPQQGWNPRLAFQSRIASLVSSKIALVTDPEPTWLNQLAAPPRNKNRPKAYYIRYQGSEVFYEHNLKWISARAIGRRSSDGKPNLTAILNELGVQTSQDYFPNMPQNLSANTAMTNNSEIPSSYSTQPSEHFQQNTQTQYPKRLIEVDLPIKRISAHARREKSIRHGHISTLHIWWARRPLAACRAVICAALWPDPADPLCPQAFRDQAASLINDFAKQAASNNELAASCAPDTWNKWLSLAKPENQLDPTKPAHQNVLRFALLDFIADFANWDNSTRLEYLATSRALTAAAHIALGGEPGIRPLVADPFAGGGAIPLEALRVGADAFASDLNPVAVLLNKVVLEYIPKYGQRLADEVRKWGTWVKQETEKELSEFYPKDPDGATPIAYLWARTILSEAPSQDGIPIEVPILRSLWLAKKKGKSQALRWSRDEKGEIRTRVIEVTYDDGRTFYVRQPILEIFQPTSNSDVGTGTSQGGAVTCPITGFTTSVESVRKQLAGRRGGARDARLICVVFTKPKVSGRNYRLPNERDFRCIHNASLEIEKREKDSSLPHALIPDGEINHLRGFFNVVLYGMTRWGDLFSPRQSLAISTLIKHVREIGKQISIEGEVGLATAIQVCLALQVDKIADLANSLCAWDATVECPHHLFARQAIPITWDFCEGVVTGASSGSWEVLIERFGHVIESIGSNWNIGLAQQASATAHPYPDDSVDIIVTDPPYYAAIPYADLSDFFYSWLKRTLFDVHPDLFQSELTPKADECVSLSHRAAMYRNKNNAWFESKMTIACSEARRINKPLGIGVFVFANKETAGWEAMLTALIEAGWVLTASWPIDTEMGSRLRARDSAVLASSVHLVCRPRENPDGSLRKHDIGDWRNVLQELPRRIHEWMPRLASEGVVGADAIFACLGPALEIFSRYARVEKASGETVTLREYLEHVWAAVAKEALQMIFAGADATGFEEDARLTAMWFWTLNTKDEGGGMKDEGESESSETGDDEDEEASTSKVVKVKGYTLEFDAARKIAQGLGAHLESLAHLIEVKGDKARLLPVAERTKYLFGKEETAASSAKRAKKKAQGNLFAELEEAESVAGGWGVQAAPRLGDTVLDRIHQGMILFAAGRGEALRRFLVDDGAGHDERFWRLANALSALYPTGSEEKRWVDGVLARKKGLGF